MGRLAPHPVHFSGQTGTGGQLAQASPGQVSRQPLPGVLTGVLTPGMILISAPTGGPEAEEASMTTTTCSYCSTPALYIGAGQDGDSYCSRHLGRAADAPTPLLDDDATYAVFLDGRQYAVLSGRMVRSVLTNSTTPRQIAWTLA